VKIAPGKHTDTYRSVCTNDRESCASMTEQLAALGISGSDSSSAILTTLR